MLFIFFAGCFVILAIPPFLSDARSEASTQAARLPSASGRIQALLKSSVYDRVVSDREVMTHARLDEKHYSFYASMLVRTGLLQTKAILTNYELYAKMIPYVDRAIFSKEKSVLEISGGIWKWMLHSWIHFEARDEGKIHFQIIAGHFTGMSGDILFESLGEKGTLVYMGGTQTQSDWPPRLIIERGAEVVFGFTGSRMRSYIESTKQSPSSDLRNLKNDQEIPQPRSRL